MSTVFIGLLNEQEVIWRKSIDELVAIPYLKMYFKKELYSEAKNSFGGTKYYYKYTAVDSTGNKTIIDIGQFGITEISPETLEFVKQEGKYVTGRDILVFDKSKSVTRIYRSNGEGEKFLIKDLLSLINSLKAIPDWDIFMSLSRIPILEAEIVALKEKVNTQKERIRQLMTSK